MNNRIVIVGGGSRAKLVASILHSLGHNLLTVVDDDPQWHGRDIGGVLVGDLAGLKVVTSTTGILGVDDNDRRRRLAQMLRLRWMSAIHPAAAVQGSVGEGAVIGAGAVLAAGAAIGDHAMMGAGTIVEDEARVGPFAQVGSGSILASGALVQEGAILGVGCIVQPGITIGAWSKVAGGSLVAKDIPSKAAPDAAAA
jgi:acetyltransferase EpsM